MSESDNAANADLFTWAALESSRTATLTSDRRTRAGRGGGRRMEDRRQADRRQGGRRASDRAEGATGSTRPEPGFTRQLSPAPAPPEKKGRRMTPRPPEDPGQPHFDAAEA